MQVKIFSVMLCVFISRTVKTNNLTKPSFPNHSSLNESTEDYNNTENDVTSVNSVPGFNALQNVLSPEISGESHGLQSLNGLDCNANTSLQTSNVPNQNRDESTKGQSTYKRVFVGKDASGSEIYTSSPKMERAVSLAENIRVVGSGLEILKKRKDVQTEGSCLANSLDKRMKKHKKSSTKIREKNTVSKRTDSCYSSEWAASAMCLSRQMILNPELRSSYDNYMFSHREALNMMSLDERELLEMIFRSTAIEQPGPSGLRVQSDAVASQHVGAGLSASRSEELNSESSNSTPDQDSSSPVALFDYGPEARLDNSLNHFVAAVNTLLTLVEGLDVYFGSARRLRASLLEQPQESYNILEEISGCLRIMIIFSRPLDVGRLGADSENRLNDVTDSVMLVNEEIWCHIIDFRNNENRDDDHGLIEYLVAILREFRNEVSSVVESAQDVMEYFQDLLNPV